MGADRQGGDAPFGSRPLKKLLVAAAVLLAAAALVVALTIAPRRLALPDAPSDGTLPGIMHVHSNRSDGSRGVDDIAAAAARAGLKFVVFTDHGDATRAPDRPAYKSGVLCIDAVEISTSGGHYIAIDLPAAPYPLAGEPRDVVEDVRRLGGFGIVAHPDSPKPQLRWSDWDVPVDGIEAVNLDTSWREWVQQAQRVEASMRARWHARGRLLAALVDYPFRSPETIASLTWRDPVFDQRLARLAERQRIVTTAGADAHAKLAYRGDPGESTYSLPIPGYEATFRALSVHASIERPLTGDAIQDARMVVRAIRRGHLYTAYDGVATPPSFELTATNSLGTVHEGDELSVGGPLALHVRSNAPPRFTTIVWSGAGVVSTDHHEPAFTVTLPAEPAVYWVTIESAGESRAVTWLRSNPVFIRGNAEPIVPPARPPAQETESIFDGKTTAGWHVESDPTSHGALDVAPTSSDGGELHLDYRLSAGDAAGQFVGIAYDAPSSLAPYDRVAFTIRADHPMRLSVQLRAPRAGPEAGDRWQRSVYVPPARQDRTVYFDDVTHVGTADPSHPASSTVRSILFVVDTTNSRPGSSGGIWITSAAVQR